MVADPQWDNPEKWTTVPGIIGFLEHTRTINKIDKQGNPLRDRYGRPVTETLTFTKKDLEEYVRNCNARDKLNQPSPLTLGHTRDDVDEKHQPDIVGYGRNMRVVYDPERKANVVLFDAYFHPEDFDRAQDFPRLSPEVWKGRGGKKILDPISLLKSSTPQLDLGQWTFTRSRGTNRLRHAMLSYAMSKNEPNLGTYRVRYAAEEIPGEDLPPPRGGGPPGGGGMPDEDEGPGMEDAPGEGGEGGGMDDGPGGEDAPGGGGDDRGPPGLEERSPGFYQNFCHAMGHYERGGGRPPTPGGRRRRAGRGARGAVPRRRPTWCRAGHPAAAGRRGRRNARGIAGSGSGSSCPQKERERMRRESQDSEVLRYLRGLDAEVRKLRGEVASMGEDGQRHKTQARVLYCERRLDDEVIKYGYVIDKPRNVELMMPMDEEGEDALIESLKKHSRVDPAADRWLRPVDAAPVLEQHPARDGSTTIRAAGGAEGRGRGARRGRVDRGAVREVAGLHEEARRGQGGRGGPVRPRLPEHQRRPFGPERLAAPVSIRPRPEGQGKPTL